MMYYILIVVGLEGLVESNIHSLSFVISTFISLFIDCSIIASSPWPMDIDIDAMYEMVYARIICIE